MPIQNTVPRSPLALAHHTRTSSASSSSIASPAFDGEYLVPVHFAVLPDTNRRFFRYKVTLPGGTQ